MRSCEPTASARPATPFWATAAAFGALWGSLEITLGSFLHTLKVPFGGAVLAAMGAGLLVAERQLCPARGVTAATAVITAMCKSLSPGGVILGPMVGITVEGLLVELALLPAPRFLGGAMLAGALAAVWAVFQKVLVQFFFYGSTAIDLYRAALVKTGRWLGHPDAGWWLVAILVGIIGAIGVAGGLFGWWVGRQAARSPEAAGGAAGRPASGSDRAPAPPAATPTNPRLRPLAMTRPRRWILAAIALGCVALQFGSSLAPATAALAVWLVALALAAPSLLRRLWMPRFWIISLIMALGSGLLLGKPDLMVGPIRVSRVGIEAGLLMVVRGGFLFALMGWASKLTVDDDVQRGLRKLGLSQFGDALTVAFTLLPSLGARVRPAIAAGRGGGLVARTRSLHRAMVGLIRHTAALARSLGAPSPLVAAVIGRPGSGKTTLVQRVLERLRAQGVRVGGVIQPAVHEGDRRVGYRLRDVATGEEIAFARRRAGTGRGFEFTDEGWSFAARGLQTAVDSADCVVLDELGRLEAQGRGHLGAWRPPQGWPGPRALLLSVREEYAADVARLVGEFELRIAPSAGAPEIEEYIGALSHWLRRSSPPDGEGKG